MRLPKRIIIILGSVLAVAFLLTIVGSFVLGNEENGVQALDPSHSDRPGEEVHVAESGVASQPTPKPTNPPTPTYASILPTPTPRVESDITPATSTADSIVLDLDSTTVNADSGSGEPALVAGGSTSDTSESLGRGLVQQNVNLRGGPGTTYDVVGSLAPNDEFDMVARNEAADWYQITTSSGQTAWVAAFLIEEAPDAELVQPSAPSNAPEPPARLDSPDTSPIQEGGNRGIEFGDPIVFDMGFGAVLVTNTTDQVKTFTTKATYKVGDSIVATAVGAVNELLPGQTRAVTLMSMEPIPDTFDSVGVDVDTMNSKSLMADGTGAASQISFGDPTVKGGSGFDMVQVEITNNDTSTHSLIVQAIGLQDGALVGVATGAVNELLPGQTKTATMVSQGTLQGSEVRLAVETVIK